MRNEDNLPEYIVWTHIEYVDENADVYHKEEGTSRVAKSFSTLEEAREYQDYIIAKTQD